MWPGVHSDLLGSHVLVHVDADLYGEAAIFKAAYWFLDRAYLFLDRDPQRKNHISIEIRPKDDVSTAALDALVGDFCNALVDFRVREEVLLKTAPIREELVHKAFSEGIRDRRITGAVSDESSIPENDDRADDDPIGAGKYG